MAKNKWHHPDYWLAGLYLFVLLFGIVMLSSVSNAVAYDKFGDSYYYLKHQLIMGVIPGGIAAFILSNIDYKKWKALAFPLLLVSIGLLMAVFLPGIGYELLGARRWIRLGPLSLQPTEIVKLTFLLYVCTWMARRGANKVQDFSDGFMPFVSTLGIIMFLIISQPDVGTMSIIVLISLVIYFVAGASYKHLATIMAGGIALLAILIKIAPYRLNRFLVFLDPGADPQGIGYHLNQALIAIGTGGITGLGFGNSVQKQAYLPEVVGDSIFAVIAEELGFLMVAPLIGIFLFLLIRGFKVAREAPDDFGKLLAIGISVWVCCQAIMNIASMMGLMPLTGLPLPLISYGSSSLVTTLAGIGILINISKQTVSTENKYARIKRW